MKRRIGILIALCMLFMIMSVQALEPRLSTPKLDLSFIGTTAYCSVICNGQSDSDKIQATLTLYQGKTYVDSWSNSGTGQTAVSGNCKVSRGKDYTLTLTYSKMTVQSLQYLSLPKALARQSRPCLKNKYCTNTEYRIL